MKTWEGLRRVALRPTPCQGQVSWVSLQGGPGLSLPGPLDWLRPLGEGGRAQVLASGAQCLGWLQGSLGGGSDRSGFETHQGIARLGGFGPVTCPL